MLFMVCDDNNKVLYNGGSWPMARAALDALVLADKGCPQLYCWPQSLSDKKE